MFEKITLESSKLNLILFGGRKCQKKQVIYLKHQTELWETAHIIGQGNTFWHTEDFKKALEYCERVLTQRELQGTQSNSRHSLDYVYHSLGILHQKMRNLEEAKKYYLKFLEKVEHYSDKNQEDFFNHMRTNLYLSVIHLDQSQYEKSEKCIWQSMKLKDLASGKEEVSIVPMFNHIAGLYRRYGRFKEARNFCMITLETFKLEIDEGHPHIAVLHCNLGFLNQDLCDYKEARKHFEKALDINRSIFGESNSAVSDVKNALGYLHMAMGDYKIAEEYFESCLKVTETLSGKEGPTSSMIYDNLAKLYQNQGKYDKAEGYMLKALKITETNAEKENTDSKILTFYNNLGALYNDMNKLEKAEEILLRTLEKAQLIPVNAEQLLTATLCTNLGQVYWKMKNKEKSEEYEKKAFKIKFDLFGEDHLEIADSYNKLGGCHQRKGDDNKALESFNKAVKITQKLAPKHPDIALFYNNIGMSLRALGNHREAYEYHEKALKLQIPLYGEENIYTAGSFCHLGKSCIDLKRYKEAGDYLDKAQAVLEKIPHLDISHLVQIYTNQVSLYREEKKPEKEIAFLKKIFEIQRARLGEKDIATIITCIDLGDAYTNLKDFVEAEGYLLKALPMISKILQEDFEKGLSVYNQLLVISGSLRKPAEAEKYMKNLIEILKMKKSQGEKETLGIYHAYYNIGRYYMRTKQMQKADEYLNRSLQISLSNCPTKKDEHIATSYQSLGDLFIVKKDMRKAKDHFEKALQIRREVLGENAPATLNSSKILSQVYFYLENPNIPVPDYPEY